VEQVPAGNVPCPLRLHHPGPERLVRPEDLVFLFREAWLVVFPDVFTRPGRLMGWAVHLDQVERIETVRHAWRRRGVP
jgi:hypothetical protein